MWSLEELELMSMFFGGLLEVAILVFFNFAVYYFWRIIFPMVGVEFVKVSPTEFSKGPINLFKALLLDLLDIPGPYIEKVLIEGLNVLNFIYKLWYYFFLSSCSIPNLGIFGVVGQKFEGFNRNYFKYILLDLWTFLYLIGIYELFTWSYEFLIWYYEFLIGVMEFIYDL